MARESGGGGEQDPMMEAEQRWGVDLNDNEAVLKKLVELQSNTREVSDLSNLWRDFQDTKKAA